MRYHAALAHLHPMLATDPAPSGATAAFGWVLCLVALGVAALIAALALRADGRADAESESDAAAGSAVTPPTAVTPVRHLPARQPADERRAPVTLAG